MNVNDDIKKHHYNKPKKEILIHIFCRKNNKRKENINKMKEEENKNHINTGREKTKNGR